MDLTLVTILGVVTFFLAAYNTFLGLKYIPRRQRVAQFIRAALYQIDASLEGDDSPTDAAQRAHAVVKTLHEDLIRIDQFSTRQVFDTLSKALGAARIYYWVRQLEGERREVVQELMNEQFLLWKYKRVRQSSCEFVLHYVQDIADVDSTRRQIDLKELKMHCQEQIAELRKLDMGLGDLLK